jgi:hypothetical protein
MERFLYYLKRYGIIGIPFIVTVVTLLIGNSLEHKPTITASYVFAGITFVALLQHLVRVGITSYKVYKETLKD